MQTKKTFVFLALFLILSMSAATLLTPNASAHSPPWQIPTYAYITAEPSPIGVGQTAHIYMWLSAVYGGAAGPIAGGTTPANPANGSTASAALLSNNYRFKNYNLTTIKPDGTVSSQTFATVTDPTSSQYVTFTPDQTGTYQFIFNFPGQVYGAGGDGYEKSLLFGDTYMPSTANTTLVVQQEQIKPALSSYPLPTEYWSRPIYGENTDWWTISSNWLGNGSPPVGGWSSAGGYGTLYHPDAQGPLTSHIMWTRPLQFGGVVGGNQFGPGGSDPNPDAYGVAYFEGSSYAPRFYFPIIIQGILYYTETSSFTGSPIMGGSSTGPTVALDLRTGKSNQSVDIAVAAGDEPLSRRFGFRLTEFPIGVATSSGRFSHALSFGDAEAATVFCKNATIADAAATAVGNAVKGDDAQAGIQAGIKRGLLIEGVEGVMVIYKGEVGTAGKIPQIIKVV